jgi:hypothetical protein
MFFLTGNADGKSLFANYIFGEGIVNAKILEKPDKESESGGMIKFQFKDGRKTTEIYERPIVRWVRIKSGEGKDIGRPVVRMKFCIAGRWTVLVVALLDVPVLLHLCFLLH